MQRSANHVERHPKGERHNQQESRYGSPFAGEHGIDVSAALMLLAFAGLHHGLVAQRMNEGVTHIGDGSAAVESAMLLKLFNHMVEHAQLVGRQVERLEHQVVALHQLACGKTARNASLFGMVLNEVHNGVNAAVNGAVGGRIAKVGALRTLLISGNVQRVLHQLGNALVFGGGDWHHRNAEQLFHKVDTNGAVVVFHLIHHVQRQHHRHVEFHQLHGEVEVALDVSGIDNVDDSRRFLLENKVARHHLLAGVRRQRIYARQVGDQSVGMTFYCAALSLYCHAGEISHVLVRAGELIEQRGFAAVLIAYKGES